MRNIGRFHSIGVLDKNTESDSSHILNANLLRLHLTTCRLMSTLSPRMSRSTRLASDSAKLFSRTATSPSMRLRKLADLAKRLASGTREDTSNVPICR